MALTQIPLDTPPAPVKPPSEQLELELYSQDHWESAYRHMHDFPTLLIQAQDDLARSRKREAFWMSLFAHALLVLLILHPPDFAKYWFRRSVMVVKPVDRDRQLTFIESPPDTQKPVKPPNTDKLSDKSRIASTRQPQLDRREMKKILDLARKGRPGEKPAPAAEPPHPGMQQPALAQAAPQPSPPPPAPPQVAKLSSPPPQKPLFSNQSMSASRAIEEAANATAASRGNKYPGDMGELGTGQRQMTTRMGPEILSDTLGVDFGPYLEKVVREVKKNWYAAIPESIWAKKGEVSIQFTILKDGQVTGMHLVAPSGDDPLDRAAWSGINFSTPFPALPTEFTGPYLTLRFDFFYNLNPDGSDLQ